MQWRREPAREDIGVIISLTISVGFIVLAVLGTLVWRGLFGFGS